MFALRHAAGSLATIALVCIAGACNADQDGSDANEGSTATETRVTSPSTEVGATSSTIPTAGGASSLSSVPAGILAIFDASSPERYVLGAAINRLISQCMQQAGFDATTGISDTGSGGFRPFWESNFGLFDEANATANGYQFVPAVAPSESGESSPPVLTPEYLAALEGDQNEPVDVVDPVTGLPLGQMYNPRGCVGQANDAVYGSFEELRYYRAIQLSLQQSAYNVLETVRTSEEYVDLTRKWADCMKEHGYEYSNVFDPSSVQWPSPPSQLEIETAKADVSCKATIQMKDGIAAILASELESTQASMSGLFDEFIALTQTYLDRAEATG